MKAQHTPAPFEWTQDAEGIINIYANDNDGYEIRIAELDQGDDERDAANAAHIVHCVNSFDALLAALQEAHDIAFKMLPKNAVRTHYGEMVHLACIQKLIHEAKKGAE